MTTNTTTRTTKTVQYSYPSSDNARRFGFNKTGCFTVETIRRDPEIQPPEAIAAFPTLADAIAHAETLAFPWDRYTRTAE